MQMWQCGHLHLQPVAVVYHVTPSLHYTDITEYQAYV